MFLKSEKWTFEQAAVKYLGLIVSHDTIAMDPVKLTGIAEWPTPRSVKDM